MCEAVIYLGLIRQCNSYQVHAFITLITSSSLIRRRLVRTSCRGWVGNWLSMYMYLGTI
jgi:hypothetical protein